MTDIRQVELTDGSLREFSLPGLGLGMIAISPAAGRLGYRVPEGFFVRERATGETGLIPYEWPTDGEYQVVSHDWSPDGKKLAFTVSLSSCEMPEDIDAAGSSIRILDLKTGRVTDGEPRNLVVAGWPDPEALQVFSSGKRLLVPNSSVACCPSGASGCGGLRNSLTRSPSAGQAWDITHTRGPRT